jgi:tRNA/tmRNA/rRNA uracil-C5-methylase (TrmA/RlmC/RlmD family)
MRCARRTQCAPDWPGDQNQNQLDQDYIDERLPVAGKEMIYRQVENSFTQPNAAMNIQMLEWALKAPKGNGRPAGTVLRQRQLLAGAGA